MDISKLIEDYTPPSEPFAVSLPGGEVLTFRAVGGLSDWERLKGAAVEFARSLPEPSDVGHPLHWAAEATPEDAFVAFVIADRSVEPAITPSEALRIVLKCGLLADQLYNAIRLHSKEAEAVRLAQRLEDAKKKGDPIVSSGSD